ncbi:MAG: sulfite exporter TauE/SafE family protein [Actinomycetota bacterium]
MARATAPLRFDDVVPVGGFLAGKLVSHALFGALLGLLGEAVQIGFRTRSLMQIVAGVLMLLMAANLLGARGLQRLVPSAPPGLARLVRRTARSEAAFAPAILGFMTVLIPCGVTLSVMFLAIASGSPILGAVGMAIFVLGTSPLFVALGYAVRRSSGFMRGRLTKLAAAAVIVAGVLSINSGLVLRGSSLTLQSLWSDDRVSSLNSSAAPSAAKAVQGPRPASPDSGAAAAAVSPDGVQQLVIDVRDSSYSPARLKASAGIPTVLTLRTNGTQGCTRGFVIPSMRVQKVLPATGETTIDLGTLQPGRLNYTCSMGMYSGSVDVT